ncbi:DUF4870 domain-containing protein [Candidatus Shapirobacteria bacterium]|nr:DUF4870 domain-containing protein [Candidatus Shapirobacteria bacterium]
MAEEKKNSKAALTYLLGLITGIYFYVTEKENAFIRFHARQSIIFSVVATVGGVILGIIPVINLLIYPLWGLACFALWLLLMVKAYQGEEYKIPWLTDFVEEKILPKIEKKK